MNKVFLKETKKELGISLYQAVCPIGSRVSSNFRSGDICITFPQIMPARIFINKQMLRAALLQEPEKTERLLGIRVVDIMPKKVLPTNLKKQYEPVVADPVIPEKKPVVVEDYEPEEMPLTIDVIDANIFEFKSDDSLINKPVTDESERSVEEEEIEVAVDEKKTTKKAKGGK